MHAEDLKGPEATRVEQQPALGVVTQTDAKRVLAENAFAEKAPADKAAGA